MAAGSSASLVDRGDRGIRRDVRARIADPGGRWRRRPRRHRRRGPGRAIWSSRPAGRRRLTRTRLAVSPTRADVRAVDALGRRRAPAPWEARTGPCAYGRYGQASSGSSRRISGARHGDRVPARRRLLADGQSDTAVRLFDLTLGARVLVMTGHRWRCHGSRVQRGRKHARERAVATTGSGSGDRAAGRQLALLTGHTTTVRVTFTSDGRSLVSASDGGATRFWDVHEPTVTPSHHHWAAVDRRRGRSRVDEVACLASEADGSDRTTSRSGQVELELAHGAPLVDVAVSADGSDSCSRAGADGTISGVARRRDDRKRSSHDGAITGADL